jgi:hypothetical protein
MTEATTSAPCCENCRYSVVGSTLLELACHRYAPKPSVTDGRWWAAWPLVASSDWCGEWASPPEVDLAPPTPQYVQDLADFLAMTGSPSHGDTTPLPASGQQEALPTTYDQFEDPLA